MSPLVWLSVWSLLWNFLLFPWFPAFPAILGNRPGRKSSVNWKCEKEIVHLVHNYSVTGREPRKNWRYCTFVPPFCSWWLIMKKALSFALALTLTLERYESSIALKNVLLIYYKLTSFVSNFPAFSGVSSIFYLHFHECYDVHQKWCSHIQKI